MCNAACPCGAGILPLSHSVSRFARAWGAGAGAGGHGACLEGKVDRVIRLVASDMDGTLLDEGSQVPPETFGLIEAAGQERPPIPDLF